MCLSVSVDQQIPFSSQSSGDMTNLSEAEFGKCTCIAVSQFDSRPVDDGTQCQSAVTHDDQSQGTFTEAMCT